MRADIHNGREHERAVQGPDTEAQDQSSPSVKSGLQHTADVMSGLRPFTGQFENHLAAPDVNKVIVADSDAIPGKEHFLFVAKI